MSLHLAAGFILREKKNSITSQMTTAMMPRRILREKVIDELLSRVMSLSLPIRPMSER